MTKRIWILICVVVSQAAFATPHWNEQKVPKDSQFPSVAVRPFNIDHLKIVKNDTGLDILRIQVDWEASNESYAVKQIIVEPSGTQNLLERSKRKPHWGSYLGILKDRNGREVYYDSIGTGKEYRILSRAINLRFPIPSDDMTFELFAENPKTGDMEKVISQIIHVRDLPKPVQNHQNVEVRELALASKLPALRINIYAEGYLQSDEDAFWKHAMKTVNTLQKEKFPGVDHMSFYGVFHSSNRRLGPPKDLGYPIPVFDTFLGLYYPYWAKFERWYNGMYPTDENKLREGIATAPYDYPIILTYSTGYWGVGNYMSLTAIPAAHPMNFTYLLIHEFGHYFGLNEEYEGGGRTELEFAPDINEPWSQNITFLVDKNYQALKWKKHVNPNTPLPTPYSVWESTPPVYGAYRGGYADSLSTKGKSHKPGLDCIMEASSDFCDICKHAISEVVQYSLGKESK